MLSAKMPFGKGWVGCKAKRLVIVTSDRTSFFEGRGAYRRPQIMSWSWKLECLYALSCLIRLISNYYAVISATLAPILSSTFSLSVSVEVW